MVKLLEKIKNFFTKKIGDESHERLDEFFEFEKLYKTYNADKLKNIIASLPIKKRDVFNLIPILLCYNHKALPGFIKSRQAISGIANFIPTAEHNKLISRYFKRGELSDRDIEEPAIELLALIGSLGSIAQTETSDFDFWVCMKFEAFTEDQILQFREKLAEIEKWAFVAGDIEVHFFLMDLKHIQSNYFGESGAESSGTALGKLLKEEFYRTATYLYGKLPYWCIVAHNTDDEAYAEIVDFLRGYKRFCTRYYIDLGNVHKISKGEFFGAALWEIVKGWRYPFKSILKMALLEQYLSNEGASELLCNMLKKKIFQKPLSPKNDPYFLLFDTIFKFYKKRGDLNSLEIIKKCFYIKIKVRASEIFDEESPAGIKDISLQRYFEVFKNYFKKFVWDKNTYIHLESFNKWSIKDTNGFIGEIDNAMISMYKRIMQIVRVGENIAISDTDLTILGRKIQSIFRKAQYKIPYVASVRNTDIIGSIVLHQRQRDAWNLYFGTKRELNPELDPKEIIYSSSDMFEILAWIVLNEYYKRGMYLLVRSDFYNHNTNMLIKMIESMQDMFLPIDISSLPSNDLLNKEKIKKLYIIPNYLKDTSHVIENIRIFYINSWGEFFYRKFEDVNPTITFLNTIFSDSSFFLESHEENIEVFIPEKVIGRYSQANQKLKEMLHKMTTALKNRADHDVMRRFVAVVDEKYAVFYLQENKLKISFFENILNLYSFFEMPAYKSRIETIVNDDDELGYLKIMCDRAAKYGEVDIILQLDKGGKTHVIVIDEIGNITFLNSVDNSDLPYFLGNHKRFIDGCIKRIIREEVGSPYYGANEIPVKFYKVGYLDNKFFILDSTKAITKQIFSLKLHPFHVKVEKGINKIGEEGYIVTIGDEIIDDSEYPDILNEIMNRIRKLRGSNQSYNIFITELSIDSSFKNNFCPKFSSTSHFLIYKRILEGKLRL